MIEREQIVVAVPESLEDRDAVVAQVEQAGGLAVTSSELEAMQQQIAESAPTFSQTLAIKPVIGSRLSMIAALTALSAAESVGHARPQPFPDTTSRRERERAERERHFDATEKAQAAKIAFAKSKRQRKAKKRAAERPQG